MALSLENATDLLQERVGSEEVLYRFQADGGVEDTVVKRQARIDAVNLSPDPPGPRLGNRLLGDIQTVVRGYQTGNQLAIASATSTPEIEDHVVPFQHAQKQAPQDVGNLDDRFRRPAYRFAPVILVEGSNVVLHRKQFSPR